MLNVIAAKLFGLFFRSLTFLDVQQLLSLSRQRRMLYSGSKLFPGKHRAFLYQGKRFIHDAGRVPVHGAANLREGPAIQFCPRRQTDSVS